MPSTMIHRSIDLLTWPAVGRFLKWRHCRLVMQVPVALLAAWIIFDGLVGPQLAPKNLATVGVWLHYRGLAVLALLLAGNLFCMACPFMLTRRAGRWVRERLLRGGYPVPRVLRNKWIAVSLVVLFFFVYERYDLWATPWWTAWVALAYFAVALVVDTIFRGAAFCKHVCPLGQFNFFGSLISPLEIKIRDANACAGCRTKDCIKARPEVAGLRGCELALFQERKAGNMDCTFCLDCVHACPYDNIGLIGRTPTAELWSDPWRSGIGRFSQRTDLAALVTVLTFGAYLNAFAMIRPVYALLKGLAQLLRTPSPTPGLLLIFAIGLLLLPAILLGSASALTRILSAPSASLGEIARRYVWVLVPMGFGMWLAHYAFHFLTGALTIVPVVQSFLADVSLYGGDVRWDLGPLVPQGWLFPIEAALLYLGATGSVVAAVRIAQSHLNDTRRQTGKSAGPNAALAAASPWMLLTLLLLGFGIWILVQPMEMRGTMMMVRGG
jgi:ferredoxin